MFRKLCQINFSPNFFLSNFLKFISMTIAYVSSFEFHRRNKILNNKACQALIPELIKKLIVS